MRYRGSLTIPAGTTQAAPATEDVALCAGIITEVEVMFPAGQSGLTYVQVWYRERQIFPTSAGEAFRGDDHVIQFGEHWIIDEVPHGIQLRGWAPGSTLDHTIYVDISVQALDVVPASGYAPVALPEGM